MSEGRVAVIGGSGFYDFPDLEDRREERLDTPYGAPSDAVVTGTLAGKPVAFLPRHGRGHRILPHELNHRANIWALRSLGVRWIISVTAVGSLQEKYAPTDFVIPDQFFDRTRARAHESTFFGEGIVGHITFAEPVCSELGDILEAACKANNVTTHRGGTYICMEGPAFSTKAESNVYRQWGMDVIGMTNLQEAKLAREAEICYATMALVTDYDCWHESHEAVSVEQVLDYLRKNAAMAQTVLRNSIPRVAARKRDCGCVNALQYAMITDPAVIPETTKQHLAPLIGKYVK
jgi:5'-methylthioadenosine phosphorylase